MLTNVLSRCLAVYAPETGAAAAPKSAKEKLREQRQTRGTANDKSAAKKLEEAKSAPPAPPMKSEQALAATLEEVQTEGKKFEGNGTAKVAKAVLAYLEERQRQAGNAKIEVKLEGLREHCYELVHYKRKGEQGEDISSPAFEACVRRGIQAALLIFDNVKEIHIPAAGPMAGKIVAPANKIIPTIKAPMQGGKKVEVSNPDETLIPVPVKLLETVFRDTHPATKSGKGRKPRPSGADGGKDKPLTREDMAGLPTATIMLELIGRLAKMTKIEGTERDVAADLLLALDRLMEGDGIGNHDKEEAAA